MQERELLDRFGWLSRKTREKERCIILLFEGNDVIGIKKLSALLSSTVNPGNLHVSVPPERNCENENLPFLIPYQASLPPAGDIWILEHSWYHEMIHERIASKGGDVVLNNRLEDVQGFEKTLSDGRYIILRVSLLRDIEKLKKDYKKKVKGSPLEGILKGKYYPVLRKGDKYLQVAGQIIEQQAKDGIRWIQPVEEKRKRARLQVLESICDSLDRTLQVDSLQEAILFSAGMEDMRKRRDSEVIQ